jgi:CDP-diacylglycerol--inositol 3-phosphatidyltransferase
VERKRNNKTVIFVTNSNLEKMAQISASQVLRYYPNIIGYVRFILMSAAFVLARDNWKAAITCYLLAFVGDVVDGYVARAFNQCKIFRL